MKPYTLRYFKGKNTIYTKVKNIPEAIEVLNGDAKGCFVSTQIQESLPFKMYRAIEAHNQSLLALKFTCKIRK